MTGFRPGQNKKISPARFKAPEIFEFIIFSIVKSVVHGYTSDILKRHSNIPCNIPYSIIAAAAMPIITPLLNGDSILISSCHWLKTIHFISKTSLCPIAGPETAICKAASAKRNLAKERHPPTTGFRHNKT